MNNRSLPTATMLSHLAYRDVLGACDWLTRVFWIHRAIPLRRTSERNSDALGRRIHHVDWPSCLLPMPSEAWIWNSDAHDYGAGRRCSLLENKTRGRNRVGRC